MPRRTLSGNVALAVFLGIAPAALGQGSNTCSTAQTISGCDACFAFSTIGATTDGPDHGSGSLCFENAVSAVFDDVWYCWTGTFLTGDQIAVETCPPHDFLPCSGSIQDTKIAVYGPYANCTAATADCATLTTGDLLACDDTGAPAGCTNQAFATFTGTAGQTYLIRFGGPADTAGGSGGLTIDCAPIVPVGLQSFSVEGGPR